MKAQKEQQKGAHEYKYYARDCRGRFIKKRKKTLEDLNTGREYFTISEHKPVWLYVQAKTNKTNFHQYWRENNIDVFKTRAGLSLLPDLKTWKVLVSGHFYRDIYIDEPGIYKLAYGNEKTGSLTNIYQDFIPEPLAYEEVVKLRQDSGNPLYVEMNYEKFNLGVANVGTHNIGLRNYGVYNKGVQVMGIFNTNTSSFYMFNKPYRGQSSWLKVAEQIPNFLRASLPPYSSKKVAYVSPLAAFEKAKKEPDWPQQYEQLLALPNFDYYVFEEITGISKKMLDDSMKDHKKKKKARA